MNDEEVLDAINTADCMRALEVSRGLVQTLDASPLTTAEKVVALAEAIAAVFIAAGDPPLLRAVHLAVVAQAMRDSAAVDSINRRELDRLKMFRTAARKHGFDA